MEQKIIMHPALKRFLANGERELAKLDEPERSAAAARLHAEMLRKFMPDEPVEPLRSGDLAASTSPDLSLRIDDAEWEKQDAKFDLLEKFDDTQEPEAWDGERESRTRMQKTNVAKPTTADLSSWDGRLRDSKMPAEHMPQTAYAAGLECAGNFSAVPDPVDAVSLGDYFEDSHADYRPTRPYHDRVAGVIFRAQRPWRQPTNPTGAICQQCGERFEGRKGQKYCSRECLRGK
jgi:hypothetical protein